MKKALLIWISCMCVAVACQSQQLEADSVLLQNLGKGTLFLRDRREIRNMRLYRIHGLYITYRKEGNLHDVLKEDIVTITFPQASPDPVEVIFNANGTVIRRLSRSR